MSGGEQDPALARMRLPFPVALVQAVVLGLVAGLGFLLPVLVWLLGEPGTARSVATVIAGVLAVALVRRMGRALFSVMDRSARGGRPVLLLGYGLAAMLPLVVLLLMPPRWAH